MVIGFVLVVSAVVAYDPTGYDFVVYGDSHAGYEGDSPEIPPSEEIHLQVIDMIYEIDPDFIVHTGDFIHKTAENGCDIYYSMTQGMRSDYDYYLSNGNHDKDAACDVDSWYYFTYEDSLFISIEVPFFTTGLSQEKYDWLENILANSNERFKFIYFHNPPYTLGMRGPNMVIRNNLTGLVDQYDVDIVFTSHTHAYERFKVDGVNYVVFGGAGGVPHSLTGNDVGSHMSVIYFEETYGLNKIHIDKRGLHFMALDLDGEIIDEFRIKKKVKKKWLISAIHFPWGF